MKTTHINIIEEAQEDFQYYNVPLSKSEQIWLNQVCDYLGVNIEMVLAIMKTESNFDISAISVSKALGIMQVLEKYINYYENLAKNTLDHFNITEYNIYSFKYNTILGITALLEWYKIAGDWDLALNCYNKGYNGFTANKDYIEKVKENYPTK